MVGLKPRWPWLAAGLLGAAGAVSATIAAWNARTEREALDRAKQAMGEGRLAVARRQLAEMAARRPGRGEVEFHLGVCELALGRTDAALAAFARVPPDSEQSGWADVHRAGILLKLGRLSDAEALYLRALDRAGSHASEACWELVRLLRLQGRFAESRRLFQAHFDAFPDPVGALKDLYRIDVDPFPAEGVRQLLAESLRRSPDDDRARLGLAHLATRAGDLDEADRLLRDGLRSRPDDPAVWRHRLDWALAADRPDAVAESLARLPADDPASTRLDEVRAWFAARRGDRDAERAALRLWLEVEPANPPALERLAVLEILDGRPQAAEELRRRKAHLERARDAYLRLLRLPDPRAHASDLADLAGSLGRRFDADRWAALAAGGRPAAIPPPDPPPAGRTLADLLPELRESASISIASRPGPSPPPEAHFVDDSAACGLGFIHRSGSAPGRPIPPVTFSGGVGLLDFDGDGWLDVFAVQSGRFPPGPSTDRDGDRLFRNRGDGTFEDATESAGLAAMPRGYGYGVAVGDYDGDGHPDLFVTRWRSYALYRNRGDGTFEDATEPAGLSGDRDWPTSAAFADLDGDGDLDLYVCHYLVWDEDDDRTCTDPDDPSRFNCSPRDFPARPDHVFRNDGGRFVDVTEEAGIVDRDGRGLGVVASDLDGDGRVDLFVANDMTANYLFRNLGGFRFEEVAHQAGVAANADGGYQAGMGVACGDLDGDGLPDLAVTNYYNESTSFFHQLGGGLFADHTAAIGLAGPSRDRLGFGLALPDVNNDGRLDLMSANGHIHDGRPQFPWKMRAQLLLGTESGRLVDATGRAGEPFQVPHIARGLAVGDLDNDGRVDAILHVQDEPLVYLRNRTEAGHFLVLRLQGTSSNRDAVGAVVSVTGGGRRTVHVRSGGGSYQSAGDPRIHVGLGEATRAESLEVRWPSGRVDRHRDLAADTGYLLREGQDHAQPLEGWPAPGGARPADSPPSGQRSRPSESQGEDQA